jgi:hypothetical protein
MGYEHPWGVASHALAILLLPGFVGNFLGTNGNDVALNSPAKKETFKRLTCKLKEKSWG